MIAAVPACPICGETRQHAEKRTYTIQGQQVTYKWFACLHNAHPQGDEAKEDHRP